MTEPGADPRARGGATEEKGRDVAREIKTTIACLGSCRDGLACCGCLNLREISTGQWQVYCNESGRVVASGGEGVDEIVEHYVDPICGDRSRLVVETADNQVHCWNCGHIWTWERLQPKRLPQGAPTDATS